MARRISSAPLTGDDPRFHLWSQQVTELLSELPPLSTFSFSSPNSNVTAEEGAYGVNLASGASTVWIKQTGNDNSGWTPIA